MHLGLAWRDCDAVFVSRDEGGGPPAGAKALGWRVPAQVNLMTTPTAFQRDEPRDVPTLDEVRRISSQPDSVLANLQITLAYHRISAALVDLLGPTVNWCTFATWASKQAGVTIRRRDLVRTFERWLGGSPEATRKVDEVAACLEWLGALAWLGVRPRVREALRSLAIFDRVSEAIAAGNRKVFDEIGGEFVRFIGVFQGDQVFDEAKIERFCARLEPGEPPHGQGRLRAAFRALYRAMFEERPRVKTQLILLASFEIGLHEQTRLQPEIAAALDAPAIDPHELQRRLVLACFPRLGVLRPLAALYLRGSRRLAALWDPLTATVRRLVRQTVTELLMTLSLPGDRLLHLSRDVEASFPENVRLIVLPELQEILPLIDPTPDSFRESGARDWADLGERMHFIADFFRSHVNDESLLSPPFSRQQMAEIQADKVAKRFRSWGR